MPNSVMTNSDNSLSNKTNNNLLYFPRLTLMLFKSENKLNIP